MPRTDAAHQRFPVGSNALLDVIALDLPLQLWFRRQVWRIRDDRFNLGDMTVDRNFVGDYWEDEFDPIRPGCPEPVDHELLG